MYRKIFNKDLKRPYLDSDGNFKLSSIPGGVPVGAEVLVYFFDLLDRQLYSCFPNECGQRGNKSQDIDPLVFVEVAMLIRKGAN